MGDYVVLTKDSCGGLPPNHAECIGLLPCNTIDDNATTQAGGATVRAFGEAQTQVQMEDVELRRNSGSHLLSVSGEFGLSLRNCLIAEHHSSDSGVLIETSDGESPTVIDSCTITNNTLGAVAQVNALQGLSLTHSILWQAGSPTFRLNGSGALQLADVVSNVVEFQGFDSISSPNVLFADPQLVGAAGNYHLRATSPAVDFAATGIARDLDGNARGLGLVRPAMPFDVGAFERQTLAAVTFPPSETFDETDPTVVQLPFGWNNVVVNDTGVSSGWTVVGDSVFNGSYAAHAADPDGITDAVLETPAFSFARDGRVSFHHRFVLDFFGTEYFDGAVLELAIDGGAYSDIVAAGGRFVAGGYNATISSQWFSPIAGRAAWSADSGGWQKVVADLPAAANGHSVKLRWRLASDQANPSPGYWLDDVSVVVDSIFRDGFGR